MKVWFDERVTVGTLSELAVRRAGRICGIKTLGMTHHADGRVNILYESIFNGVRFYYRVEVKSPSVEQLISGDFVRLLTQVITDTKPEEQPC